MAEPVPVIEKKRKRARKKGPAQPQPKKKSPVPMRPEMEVQQTVAGARKLATAGDDTAALQMMAQAFEGLDDAVGVDPWEPGTFLAWAQEQSRSVELMASLSHRDRGDFVGQAEELRE